MARSDTILGRRASCRAFNRRSAFTVSCYITNRGQVRYSDPTLCPIPAGSVVYRIVVKPKKLKPWLNWTKSWPARKPREQLTHMRLHRHTKTASPDAR